MYSWPQRVASHSLNTIVLQRPYILGFSLVLEPNARVFLVDLETREPVKKSNRKAGWHCVCMYICIDHEEASILLSRKNWFESAVLTTTRDMPAKYHTCQSKQNSKLLFSITRPQHEKCNGSISRSCRSLSINSLQKLLTGVFSLTFVSLNELKHYTHL